MIVKDRRERKKERKKGERKERKKKKKRKENEPAKDDLEPRIKDKNPAAHPLLPFTKCP